MSLKFCPKCKAIMIPRKEVGEFIVECKVCNFTEKIDEKDLLQFSEKISIKEEVGKGISKGENLLANYKNMCKKCGYDKAQIIDMGIFYSDEDNLILLKCGKCNFAERIGRKVS